jgi:hypothetical protein
MTEGPVLVTVVPANTAKDVAVPSPTGAWAADAAGVPATPTTITMAAAAPVASTALDHRRTLRARAKRIIVTSFPHQ